MTHAATRRNCSHKACDTSWAVIDDPLDRRRQLVPVRQRAPEARVDEAPLIEIVVSIRAEKQHALTNGDRRRRVVIGAELAKIVV
jgi:hypothetical protein